MKNLAFIFLIIILTTQISCTDGAFTRETEISPSFPIQTIIEKPPLSIEFDEIILHETGYSIQLIVSHSDEREITVSDYKFKWPRFAFDENEVPYKLISYEALNISNNEMDLGRNSLLLELLFEPVLDFEGKSIILPFYLTPYTFVDGYPFHMKDSDLDQINIGDISLRDVNVNGNIIRFRMFDQHPDVEKRKVSYEFTQMKDGQEVYPLYSRIIDEGNADEILVELEYAQNISFPALFSIHRTNVNLPDWQFNLIIPIN
ncbi:hypothetical protein J2S74_003984 [Evansella vedderi]|uniref:Uncharacterized protein n=1 Tax=Evansella vedderi TaxID=38282 RepID=A0ABT9ZZ90_9BACI|nr:hypothetical protein [Evansella vedderi]MDQ0256564.1 hypothetical protein [Evansella vedderi]